MGIIISILREEPRGLLFYAQILDESDVSETAKLFHRRHPEVNDIRGHIKGYYRKSIAEATSYFSRERGRIRIGSGGLETITPPRTRFYIMAVVEEKMEVIQKIE